MQLLLKSGRYPSSSARIPDYWEVPGWGNKGLLVDVYQTFGNFRMISEPVRYPFHDKFWTLQLN